VVLDVPADEIYSEDPHRFLVAFEKGSVTLPTDARKVGIFGGGQIVINGSPLGLESAASFYREALPRRMR
jgi:hypothetical protein